MNELRQLFAKSLIAAWRRSGLTKAELSRRSGIDRGSLDAYMAGSRSIGIDAIASLSSALGVHPTEFFGGAPAGATPRPGLKDAIFLILEALQAWDRGDFDAPVMRELDGLIQPFVERLVKGTPPKK